MNFSPFLREGASEFSSQVHNHHVMVETVAPLVLDVLDKIHPVPGQTFTIGDYGTADGGTSYALLKKIIAQLRKKHGNTLPIQVVYEDQPTNDFKPVFLRAQGLVPGISGLTQEFQNVFVLASGCSFYSQCLPQCSLDLVICFNAVHWLSRSVRVSCESLYPSTSKGDSYLACMKQSEADWMQFLLMRSKELKPGGHLIVTGPTSSPDDDRVQLPIADQHCTAVWKGLLDDGYISKAEFENTHLPIHFRSHEELVKPLAEKDSPVSRSGLVPVTVDTQYIFSPHRRRIENLKRSSGFDEADSKENADIIAREFRSWQENSLYQGLEEHRSETEKKEILNLFYDRLREVFAKDPTKHCPDLLQICLVARKEGHMQNGIK